ncbi:MAG TPA: monofunctional biosynthetic peptidoglycan transglycosylase [Syntrophales bacterium]|nr:monofunctional biosynthetic peptidoglycan transglycosylase [Syntrophales bacterium]
MNLLKKIFRFFLIALFLLAGAVLVYTTTAFYYDDVAGLKKKNPGKTAFMSHREFEWEFKGLKNKKIYQVWVPLSQISPYMVKAVLIAEDDKFYSHEGFDFEAMQKAIEKDIKLGKFKYGGSTISQQLAKNLFLSPSKNPLRKAKEVILTWRIENNLSKRRILEIYLNVAEWGDGIFGIEAASRHYYGKSAAELTPMEAARLAVVLPNPLKLNPAGTSKYVEKRAEIVYGIMVRRGIVIEEYEDIMKTPADGPPADSGALKSTGVTSGSFDGVEKKEGAPEKQKIAAPEKKETTPSPASEKAGEKASALPPESKEGR